MRKMPAGFWDRIKDVDRFFQKNDDVHKTMRRTVKNLEKAGIPYALLGGMAVNLHGHRRTTNDVDILLTAEGLGEFRRRYVPGQYEVAPERAHRFNDRKNEVNVDFLLTGLFPGNHQPGPIAFPDPAAVLTLVEGIQVVELGVLIELKLAAHRYQDLADVVSLIRAQQLDESFADRLHPSVRSGYIDCVEAERREAVYDARQLGAEEI